MQASSKSGPRPFPALQVIFDLSLKALFFFVPVFLFKGTARWAAGWLYWGMYTAWSFLNALSLYRRDPGFLLRRLMLGPDVKEPADLAFSLSSPFLFAVTAAVCSRYGHWPAGTAAMCARGVAFAGLGYAYWLASRALAANSFALKPVLLQPGQTPVSAGPYAIVRHPIYSAFVLFYACTPAALGSLRGFIPAAAAALAIIGRAVFEDRFLARGLAGYAQYTEKVRFRLVPGLW